MPEGPEVRVLVDQLQPAVGMRLVNFHFMSGRYMNKGNVTGIKCTLCFFHEVINVITRIR